MRTKLILIAIAPLLLQCSGDTGTSPVPHYDPETLRLKYEIVDAHVQDLSCTDSSVCSSIGVGSKPCGGPWRHQVYSMATVDGEELTRAVLDLKEYETGYNMQEHLVSECSVARVARASCVDQRCIDLNAAP